MVKIIIFVKFVLFQLTSHHVKYHIDLGQGIIKLIEGINKEIN